MAELHIDDDWKRQAQEEKRKLAEQEKQRAASPSPVTGAAPSAAASARTASSAAGAARPGRGELPPPSFATLVQSLVTQALFYLGDLAPRGSEPQVNLDMAKHQIDTLGLLEEKTRNNLTAEEKQLLDQALYETRMRYVNVAAQYVT